MSDTILDEADVQIDERTEKRMNQHANTLTPTINRREREKLAKQMAEFEAAGGKVQKIESGLSADPVTFFVKPLATKEQQRLAYEHRRGVKRRKK